MNGSALLFFEQALRLPAGQALVDHLDGQSHLLVHALPEPRRFFGHIAARTIQPQRQPYDNLLHAMLAHKFPQPPHVLVAVDAIQRPQRLRQASFRVADGQPDSRAPVIQRQNAQRFSLFRAQVFYPYFLA